MRYEYTVTKEGGEADLIKAMSWKKAIKKYFLPIQNLVAGLPI